MLGSAADAEGAVQDTWLKWSAADRSQVADPQAYLVRIVSNRALDRLWAAKARRETYVGPWLPEPILTTTETDDVSVALLENLSPLERAVFVVKEAFAVSYARSPRRSSTRRRPYGRPPTAPAVTSGPARPGRARQREVTERFLAAAVGGDLNDLMQMLAPDVTLWTDGGGKVRQALRPILGAERVAQWLAGVVSRPCEGVHPAEMTAELCELNGAPGLVSRGPAG